MAITETDLVIEEASQTSALFTGIMLGAGSTANASASANRD
jgi:hypothetical protein